MAILVRYNSLSWSGKATMPPLFALVLALQTSGRQESDSKMFAGRGARNTNMVANYRADCLLDIIVIYDYGLFN
jgi:hypothetical protein